MKNYLLLTILLCFKSLACAQSGWGNLEFTLDILSTPVLYKGADPLPGAVEQQAISIPLGDLLSVRLQYAWNGQQNSPLIQPLTERSALVKMYVRKLEGDAPAKEVRWRWQLSSGSPGAAITLAPGQTSTWDAYLYAGFYESKWLDSGEKVNYVDYIFPSPGEYEIFAKMWTGNNAAYHAWKLNPATVPEPHSITSNSVQVSVTDPLVGWQDLVDVGLVEALVAGGTWTELGDAVEEDRQEIDQLISQINKPWLSTLRNQAVDWIGEPIPLSE